MPQDRSTTVDFRWVNDRFNFFVPLPERAQKSASPSRYFTDDSFTSDWQVRACHLRDPHELTLTLQDRWITELGGPLRQDEVSLDARYGYVMRHGRLTTKLSAGAAVVATGPLGGHRVQSWVHGWVWGGGRTLEGDGQEKGYLQGTYEGGVRVRPRLSAGVESTWSVHRNLGVVGGIDLQQAFGAGASTRDAYAGLRSEVSVLGGELRLSAHLVGRHLQSAETRLSFHGGYARSAAFLSPAFEVAYEHSGLRLGVGYALDDLGTGAPRGALQVGYRFGP